MLTLDENILADLKSVAEKHGITYETLVWRIRDMYDAEDRLEDIKTILCDEYDEVRVSDENLEIIYNRFIKAEDSEYGVWDNIRNAIEYVYPDLELRDEDF